MSLLRGAFTVGGWTLVSRVLGFARDMVIARAIGTGWVADSWAVAFRFPNLFRRLLGEGALNSAFVPMYAKRLEGDGKGAADRLAEEIQSVMLPILFAVSAAAMIAMPWIMVVYAPGFSSDPAKFALTVDMTKIAFPYLMFMSMVALYSGVLNTHGRFAAATAAQSLLNIGLLVAALAVQFALRPEPGDPVWGMALAYGCVVAGAMQFLYLMAMLARGGIPSVVFGLLGMQVLVPAVAKTFGKASGACLLSAIVVLSIMILPSIVSVSVTALNAVPPEYEQGSLALGATDTETWFKISIPAAKSGIAAGIVLGIGRAIGEAMAVMMVAGNSPNMPDSPFRSVTFLTTAIAKEMSYAGGLQRQALFSIALVLFVFIMIINVVLNVVLKGGSRDE